MAGVGMGVIVVVTVAVALHPAASNTVTVNVSDVDTMIDADDSPVLQANVIPPAAVRVVEPVPQILVLPVMDAVGRGRTMTVAEAMAEQPLSSVTVTK